MADTRERLNFEATRDAAGNEITKVTAPNGTSLYINRRAKEALVFLRHEQKICSISMEKAESALMQADEMEPKWYADLWADISGTHYGSYHAKPNLIADLCPQATPPGAISNLRKKPNIPGK